MVIVDTFDVGRRGELGTIEILERYGCEIVIGDNDNSDWDILARKDKDRTFEIKCQLEAMRVYNAFTIEIGDSSPQYFDAVKPRILHDINTNKRYYPSGLSVSKADYYVFTDLETYIFVPTKALKRLVREIHQKQPHRFKFNRATISSYGVSLSVDELRSICIFITQK